jgi:hypothetical protein
MRFVKVRARDARFDSFIAVGLISEIIRPAGGRSILLTNDQRQFLAVDEADVDRLLGLPSADPAADAAIAEAEQVLGGQTVMIG